MKLDNGFTVLIKEDHYQPVVSVQVWVKVGSVNEDRSTNGLSHFLEHLLFKGTAKYPGHEIATRVETSGGSINAATSKEYTQFHIDTQTTGFEEAVRILADAVANAALPADEIEKERPVVIEEIRRHDDNPGSVLYDHFTEAAFPTTPYRASIIGTEEVIRSVTRSQILDYYHAHYVPGNMFVSIVGDVSTDRALALVRETFGRQKKLPPPPPPHLVEPAHPGRTIERPKDIAHTYLLAGFLGPVITSDDQFVADVTAVIMGGSKSSRLYRSLRERKRLVYGIGASFWSQRGTGVIAVSAMYSPAKQREVLDELRAQIALLAEKGPSDAELNRAKQVIKSNWYLGLETFHDQAAQLGYWQMQGRPDMTDIYIDRITKVSKEDVIRFLKAAYEPQSLNMAILAPEKQPAAR